MGLADGRPTPWIFRGGRYWDRTSDLRRVKKFQDFNLDRPLGQLALSFGHLIGPFFVHLCPVMGAFHGLKSKLLHPLDGASYGLP